MENSQLGRRQFLQHSAVGVAGVAATGATWRADSIAPSDNSAEASVDVSTTRWMSWASVWDTLEVRELDWQKAMKKRNYQGPLRPDLTEAARNALEQAFRLEEAAARGIRLHK